MRLIVRQFALQNPTWQGNAWPGQDLTAGVTAQGITNDERIEFVIEDNATNEHLDSIVAAAGQTSVQWKVPNLPSTPNVSFRAILRETPSPANGQVATIMSIASPVQALQSFGVQIVNPATDVDAAFVPNHEQLRVAYTVTDAGNHATQGRYEIWGERYPGATPEPVYKANFTPAVGAQTWHAWNGQANRGYLNGKFITPEFSPYRVRIIIGTSGGDVDDPYGVGQGKVACAEAQFEIKFQTVAMRKWQNLQEVTNNLEYRLNKTLVVEPRNNDAAGTYPITAELPEDRPLAAPVVAQTGRIRIPMAKHRLIKESLGQGSLAIGGAYMGGGTSMKWDIEEPFYSRPELPIQFEPQLASRDPATYPEGRFWAPAVGAVVIEPVAEEFYNAAFFPATAGGGTAYQNYWSNAALKVKRGKHNAPYHDATTNLPEFPYWQARFEVAADGAQDFNISTYDNSLKYRFGEKELSVYLNRRLLSRSDRNDDQEIDKYWFDYREVDNGANSIRIKLRPNLTHAADATHAADVLWIVRKDSTASGNDKVKNWEMFPPGPNCHSYYGGVRGEEPTEDLSNYFRAAFSKRGKKKPIIGKANAPFPFKKYINLKPDLAKQKEQERVEVTAMLDGTERGRAGVIFSPSCVAGDAYVIHAWIEREGYARKFGFLEQEAAVKSKSGRMTVWRWSRIKDSFRLPDIGTPGLAAAVGGEAEIGGRLYHGDGANMEVQNGALSINTLYGDNNAFNEWSLTSPPSPAGDGGDPIHRHVNLANYRAAHNTATGAWEGNFPLNADTDIKNYSAVWDAYRWALPPGLPANLDLLIANTIHGLAAGTSTHAAGVAVANAIALRGLAGPDDAALVGAAVQIPDFWNADPDAYLNVMDGRWDTVMHAVLDRLTPKESSPEKMNVVRWPFLHELEAWQGYNAAGPAAIYADGYTAGFCRGDGQSMFATAELTGGVRTPIAGDNTFTHEMGHSMNLIHFVAGNFGWKHHDVNSPNCIMSYDFCGGVILREGVANPVAAGANKETGWPDAVPNPIPPNYEGAVAGDEGKPCIHYPPTAVGAPCAKCLLKIRGWKDELLPFAWGHADLF